MPDVGLESFEVDLRRLRWDGLHKGLCDDRNASEDDDTDENNGCREEPWKSHRGVGEG
jgi:hypothetical protein